MLIYALVDPRDGKIRYIGKTHRTAHRRLRRHLSPSHLTGNTHKERWLRQLLSAGLEPSIIELQRCTTSQELCEAERAHIRRLRCEGMELTNATDGGDGGGKHTPESREKIRIALTGKPKTAQHRRNSGMAQRGRKASDEARRKQSEERRRRGYFPPPRYGEANNKTKLSPEAINEICALRGKVPQRELARRFGVTHVAIGKVQRKHLRVREFPR